MIGRVRNLEEPKASVTLALYGTAHIRCKAWVRKRLSFRNRFSPTAVVRRESNEWRHLC
jgi:hypothetical protein